MPTPNAQLLDEFLHRAVDVFQMTDTEARKLAQDISDQEDQRTLAELITLFLDNPDPMIRNRALDRIFAMRSDAFNIVRDRMLTLLERFTRNEGRWVSDTVGPVQDETPDNHVFTTAFLAVLFNRVMQRPLSEWEANFDDLFKELVLRDRARIEQTMMRAFATRVGVPSVTRVLRKNFSDTAETVHIVLHAMVQHARSTVVDLAMASIGGSVRWVSVLDGRTTAICRARSGKIYPAGIGPRPPAHVRCRSIVVPFFKGKGDYKEPTYEQWLKRQSPNRVREILGVTKGNMFLRGELSLADMVTAKGRELTLKELAATSARLQTTR